MKNNIEINNVSLMWSADKVQALVQDQLISAVRNEKVFNTTMTQMGYNLMPKQC